MADQRDPGAARRLGAGAVVVLLLLAFAVTVVIGIVRGAAGAGTAVLPPGATPLATEPGAADPGVTGGSAYVHVAGAVAAPGLYRLPVGARLVDAVAAAGGFAEDADRAAVNLARTVEDGEQIVVPIVGADPPGSGGQPGGAGAPGAGSTGAGGASDGMVDLNTADATALDALPRIGPALAERIVAWRDENGRFTSVDDLLSVPGIGEKIVDGLRDAVRV